MKSYVANGTGSQQTLTESQDNKIPVYDSVADAESDLTNLEEAQLVATKDTGSELSAPVDVVQSGNMHAVTSNAVADAGSFKNTKHFTGRYWVDGKPIYNKIVSADFASSTPINIPIGEEISFGLIDFTHSHVFNSGYGWRQPWKETNVYVDVANNQVYFQTTHSAGTAYIVVEFTQ